MPVTEGQLIRIGHSPDPDDAFMFYALTAGRIDCRPYRIEHELADIQTLNERASRGELEVSAISIAAYPRVAGRYALLNCGASVGDGYGPLVVARRPMSLAELADAAIAVPGRLTTAFLTLQLCLGRSFAHEVVPFDRIIEAVSAGAFDAGLLIHEGQLTYARQGLHKVVDLGVWWAEQTALPLPLGGNVVRRDLGERTIRELADLLRRSIRFALDHRAEAVAYATRFARDMGAELADRFVGMYVNDWTVDWGERGRSAVRELLRRGHAAGLLPPIGEVTFF